jgi:hypothetical protein
VFIIERRNHYKTALYEDLCVLDPVDTTHATDRIKKSEKSFKSAGFDVRLRSQVRTTDGATTVTAVIDQARISEKRVERWVEGLIGSVQSPGRQGLSPQIAELPTRTHRTHGENDQKGNEDGMCGLPITSSWLGQCPRRPDIGLCPLLCRCARRFGRSNAKSPKPTLQNDFPHLVLSSSRISSAAQTRYRLPFLRESGPGPIPPRRLRVCSRPTDVAATRREAFSRAAQPLHYQFGKGWDDCLSPQESAG